MANKKIKINVDLDFTSDQMSLEKVRDQIDNAIEAVEINLDPKSATKFKKDLEELGKYVERHLNKNTGKIDAKNLMNDLSSNSDLKALRELGPELAGVGVQGTRTFNELTTQSNYLNRNLTESNSILSKMGTTLMNTIRWNISASAVNAVTSEFQKMYFFAKDLDRSLTNIRIVSGLSADNMNRFAKSANQAAKELKVSTIDYAEASLIFYQQGLQAMEVQNMTRASIIGGNITGESTQEMADLLTSTLNGYRLASEEVMMVTDKLAAVGASTASDFYELSTAMSKVASVANASGVPIDSLNAQLATIISVTKAAPESIGMSLKTIYGRMLAFKTNTKALMKDEDGDVFGAPKVEEALQAYNRATGAQISLFKTTKEGKKELRDLGDVIDEIGNSWENTTDKSAKFGLTTALAGSRQQNNLVALFDSWEMYQDAVETSLGAEGTALKQNEVYMESYEGRLKGLQAAKEEMYMVFTDSDSMKGFISGLTKAVEMFSKLADAAGGFNLIISGIGVVFSQSVAKKGIDLYGSINKGLRGQNTSADKEELKMTEQLEKIKKVYGAEEANRLRDTLNTKKELLKASATENDLIAEEHTLISLIGKTVKENEGATQEGKIQNLMVHNEHLGISADRVRHIQEEYQLLKMAEQELADLRLRAAEGSATDNIDAAIEKATQQVADLKIDVDHTMALIENRKFDSDRVVGFRESGEESASRELAEQHAQAQKVLQVTDMIRTASMTIPVAIKLATDESTSFGGVLGGIAASTAPMLLSGLMKAAPAMMAATAGAVSFGAGLKAALAAALPIIGPILAIGAGVAAIALVVKAINDSTVTFAKSMKELEKASEELVEQERAYEAIEQQLEQIKNRREEIAAIGEDDDTTDEEKEKLKKELSLLDTKYEKLNRELVIEEMLLRAAKEKAEAAALKAASSTFTSEYSFSYNRSGNLVGDQVKVEEELEHATDAFVKAEEAALDYKEALADVKVKEGSTAKEIEEAQKKYDNATKARDKASASVEEHSNAISKIIVDLENEEGTNVDLISSYEEYLDASTNAIAKTLGIGEAFGEAAPKEFIEDVHEVIDQMEELAKTFDDATSRLKDYNIFLDEVNSKEGLSAKSKQEIIIKHQELLPYISDEQELRRQLIKIISEEEETQRQAYTNMLMNSKEFFDAKLQGNADLVNKLKNFYGIDLSNAQSLAEAKEKLEIGLIKKLSKLWANYYRVAADGSLIGTMSEDIEAQRLTNAARGRDGLNTSALEHSVNQAKVAAKQYRDAQRDFDNLISDTFFEGVDVSLSGINAQDKKGSSSSAKDEYSAEANRYEEINQKLDKNNVLLQKNKTLQKQAGDDIEKKLKLIKKEVKLHEDRQKLLNELNEARRVEARELQNSLSKEGFKFEGSWDDNSMTITNLGKIKGKGEEVEKKFKRILEIMKELPVASQEWLAILGIIKDTLLEEVELTIEGFARGYKNINLELDENSNKLADIKHQQDMVTDGTAEHLSLIEQGNEVYKERQTITDDLINSKRQEVLEMQKLISELSKGKAEFSGTGDNLRIGNLDSIQYKNPALDKAIEQFNELQIKDIPGLKQQWDGYQLSVVNNLKKIETEIQNHIDQLKALEDELDNFDMAGKIADLNKQLDTAKFNYWIESLILGLERFNDKSELLTFKLSLFDEEDYDNRADVVADLYSASQEKLQAYREEWDKLSSQTPKNANEANQIANAMKQVQQGMREAFVATREYQRELEKIQFNAISNEFAKANKQLELQLSIIDHNLKSLQDGVLPDFSLDMVMPIPDFSDIFDETKSENERIYNEQVDFEKQIQELKKQSLAMQLQEAEDFYVTERNKLEDHYLKLFEKIVEKEAEIAELRDFLNEEQKKQLEAIQNAIKLQIEEDNVAKLEAEELHGEDIEDTKLEHYIRLLKDLGVEWLNPEYDAIDIHQLAVETITSSHLSSLQSSYANAWSKIVGTVSSAVSQIKSLVSQANASIASMGSVPTSSKSGGIPQAYAKGTDGHTGGEALVGEKGVELGILPGGRTVLLGKNGSELVDIPAGTQVIPHQETKEILGYTGNIDGKQIPKYKDGTIPKYAGGILGKLLGSVVANKVVDKVVDKVREDKDYSYRNEAWDVPDDLAGMSTRDLDEYIWNKSKAQDTYTKTGKWDSELAKANQEIRDRYGILEDKHHVDQIGKISSDIFLGQIIAYGLEHGNTNYNKIADKMGAQQGYWDYNEDDYNYGGSYSGGSSGGYYDDYDRQQYGGTIGGGYIPPAQPTAQPKPPTLNELIGIDVPDFFAEMSKEFKEGAGQYSEGIYELLEFEGYDKYLDSRKKVIEEIKQMQEDLLGSGNIVDFINNNDVDKIEGWKDRLVNSLILDGEVSDRNKLILGELSGDIEEQLKEIADGTNVANKEIEKILFDGFYTNLDRAKDLASKKNYENIEPDKLKEHLYGLFERGDESDPIVRWIRRYTTELQESLESGLGLEGLNEEIRSGLEKDFIEQINNLSDNMYEIPEEIKNALKDKIDISKLDLSVLESIMSKDDILNLIDQQMLEDTRTQSWLKLDLLEQMKVNIATYVSELKSEYDKALSSGNTELAREIFEEYNKALSQQMQIEGQINQAIKQRYDMEFALIDKKILKEKQSEASTRKDLKLVEVQNPDDFDAILAINNKILDSQIKQREQTVENLTQLTSQRDLLKIGSSEWNILNQKVEEYESSLQDANITIAEMRNTLGEISRNNLFKQFEKEINKINKKKEMINFFDEETQSEAINDISREISSKLISQIENLDSKIRQTETKIKLESNPEVISMLRQELDALTSKRYEIRIQVVVQSSKAMGRIQRYNDALKSAMGAAAAAADQAEEQLKRAQKAMLQQYLINADVGMDIINQELDQLNHQIGLIDGGRSEHNIDIDYTVIPNIEAKTPQDAFNEVMSQKEDSSGGIRTPIDDMMDFVDGKVEEWNKNIEDLKSDIKLDIFDDDVLKNINHENIQDYYTSLEEFDDVILKSGESLKDLEDIIRKQGESMGLPQNIIDDFVTASVEPLKGMIEELELSKTEITQALGVNLAKAVTDGLDVVAEKARDAKLKISGGIKFTEEDAQEAIQSALNYSNSVSKAYEGAISRMGELEEKLKSEGLNELEKSELKGVKDIAVDLEPTVKISKESFDSVIKSAIDGLGEDSVNEMKIEITPDMEINEDQFESLLSNVNTQLEANELEPLSLEFDVDDVASNVTTLINGIKTILSETELSLEDIKLEANVSSFITQIKDVVKDSNDKKVVLKVDGDTEKAKKDIQDVIDKYDGENITLKVDGDTEKAKKDIQDIIDIYDGESITLKTRTSTIGVSNAIESLVNSDFDSINIPVTHTVQNEIAKPSSVEPNIPEFAKGTDGHKGGLARVSDGNTSNKRELIIYPDGRMQLSDNHKEEIRNLPKGTHVVPNNLTEDFLKAYEIPAYADGTIDVKGSAYDLSWLKPIIETINTTRDDSSIIDLMDKKLNLYNEIINKGNEIIEELQGQLTYKSDGETLENLDEAGKKNVELANKINNMVKAQQTAQNLIKQTSKEKYEQEFKELDIQREINDELQKNLSYELDIQNSKNPKDYNTILEIQKDLSKVEDANNKYIQNGLSSLIQQRNNLPKYSAEWEIVNGKVEEYNNKLEESYRNIIRLKKEELSTSFDKNYSDIENLVFGGKNQRDIEIQLKRDNKILDDKKEHLESYLEGLEKEYTLETLKKDVSELNNKELNDSYQLMLKSEKLNKDELETFKKKLNIKQLEEKLENLKNQKTIQQLKRMEDGTWDFEYVVDQDAIDETNKGLFEARAGYEKWNKELDIKEEERGIKNREDELSDQLDFLSELEEIQDNALNGEYETQEEFVADMKKLGKRLNLDYKGEWANMVKNQVFANNQLSGKFKELQDTYGTFKIGMDTISQEISNSFIQVKDSAIDAVKAIQDLIAQRQKQREEDEKNARRSESISSVNSSSSVSSVANDSNTKKFDDSYDTTRNKEWSVGFNQSIDPSTVGNIKVVDQNGNTVSSGGVISSDGKSVSIAPPANGYSDGAYAIVADGVVSESGKELSKSALKNFTVGYDTGGYTGDWLGNGGKNAILHKKERVLSAQQTSSFEQLVDNLPNIMENIKKIKFPEINIPKIMSGLSGTSSSKDSERYVENHYHIDKVEFPNITTADEATKAIMNLPNRVKQKTRIIGVD